MKIFFKNCIKAVLVCSIVFTFLFLSLRDSGRGDYANPKCDLETELSDSNNLKPVYRCFHFLVSEKDIYHNVWVFVFLVSIIFTMITNIRLRYFTFFFLFSFAFWFVAWTFAVNIFHLAISAQIGWLWSGDYSIPTSNPEPFFLVKGLFGYELVFMFLLFTSWFLGLLGYLLGFMQRKILVGLYDRFNKSAK